MAHSPKRSGNRCRRSAISASAIRRTADAPTFATDVKVAYDATNLYVAIRAHDPEPDRLVGLRTRRDTDSSSDWLKVVDRLVPRSPHRVRVRRQSGGRQGRPRLVERLQRRQRLGRGLGRRGLARPGRLARGVPHSVLAAALPSRRQRDVRLRGRPPDRPVERDRHLAAHLEGGARFRVVVRRPHRAETEPDAQASRARALRGRTGQHAAVGGRAIRSCRPAIRRRRSART